jgi:UDPglucose 6-dehydrogenase
MDIAVVGVGHVGLVTAGAFASDGHQVVGMDDDAGKIDQLQRGEMPFFEPGLADLIRSQADAGRLRFTSELRDAAAAAQVVFVCVGTPPLPGGGPNLSYVEAVGRNVAAAVDHELVLVEKSTVPANTGMRLAQVIDREQRAAGRSAAPIHVASNPEFLREGQAVEDTLRPDRVVYGTSSEVALERLREVYAPLVARTGCPVVETDVATAELIKHASNAFLATRISFINQVARVCEQVGADVETVAHGMGLDERIGPHFLHAGLGYGGSCFPKDVDAFIHLAGQVGEQFTLLEEVRRINDTQRDRVLDKLRHELWHLTGKTIAVLGASFKPGTDDLRESPALHLARALLEEGAEVRIYDPVALPGVAEALPDAILVEEVDKALDGAHAAIVATEWPEIRSISPDRFASLLGYPIVLDGRNALDADAMRAAGLHYHGVGRPTKKDATGE